MKKQPKQKALRKPQRSDASRRPRRSARIVEEVYEIAEPLCTSFGFELVFIEFHSEAGGKVLRLYIDKPGGITLDDCARVSRHLTDILDVQLEDLGPYHLEVSSPGPERPIGKIADFNRFKGETVKVQTFQAINGRKNFTGILAGCFEGLVNLTIDDQPVAIPYEEIKKARLVDHGDYRCTCQT